MSGALYLHELVRTVGAKTDAYLDSVAEHQGRSAASAGRPNMLVGVFRALEVTGEAPQGVNLWHWGEWADAAAILGRQFEPRAQDPALKAWWLGNVALRKGGFDRLLQATSASPAPAALRAEASRPELFLHELVTVERGERENYLTAFAEERRFGSAGAVLVGAYRSVFRDDEAVTLVGFPSADVLAAYVDAELSRSTPVRSRSALVLRARHFLSSPWHS